VIKPDITLSILVVRDCVFRQHLWLHKSLYEEVDPRTEIKFVAGQFFA